MGALFLFLLVVRLSNTVHLSCKSTNIGCDLHNIVNILSFYRLFL